MTSSHMEAVALLGLMTGSPHAALELHQRLNQTELLSQGRTQVRLPRPDQRDADSEMETILQEWGVIYDLSQPEQGGLFYPATLPEGWSIKPTDHWLYSKLVDQNGLMRAQIMYHAQDHASWTSLERRFQSGRRQDNYTEEGLPYFPAIYDGNGKIHWRGDFRAARSNDQMNVYHQVLALARTPATDMEKAVAAYGCPKQMALEILALPEHDRPNWIEVFGPEPLRDPAKLCDRDACQVLAQAYPDYRQYRAYWDVLEPVFPPNGSEPEQGEEYTLSYALYNGDSFRDSSSDPYRLVCSSDAVARRKYLQLLERMGQSYDVKQIVISTKGRSFRLPDMIRPRPRSKGPFKINNRGIICDYDGW